MNRKAYSMLELIVVASLIVIMLVAAISMQSSSAIADKDLSGLEEYYNLQSRMNTMLKQDLRNAFSIKKIADGHFELGCLDFNSSANESQQLLVVYQTTGKNGLKLERRLNGMLTATFDFSAIADGRKFKFEISDTD